MILAAVLFTINPVEEAGRPLGLNMGTGPLVCVLWLCVCVVIAQTDLVRGRFLRGELDLVALPFCGALRARRRGGAFMKRMWQKLRAPKD